MKFSRLWWSCETRAPHRVAIEYAIGIPFLFTVLFLFTYPPIPSEGPLPQRSLVPCIIVLCLGVIGWMTMLAPALRAIRQPGIGSRLSGLLALVAFSAFALELYLALYAIRKR